MRLLVVHPGASFSVSDVHTGVVDALRRRSDVTVAEYGLDGRLSMQRAFLTWAYRRAKKVHPDAPVPTPDDMVRRACVPLLDHVWQTAADWVLVVSGMYVHPDIFAQLRWYGRKFALLLTESPYDDDRQERVIGFADLVWTNERSSVLGLRQVQPRTFYLPHAYNPVVHHVAAADPSVPAHDVVFVGTGFAERIEWLSGVDWEGLGLDLGLYGNWGYLGPRHRLRRYVRGGTIDNQVAADLYRRAKVGLNLFRQSMGWGKDAQRLATAESMNPRSYELAAAGCFQVSDYRPEVAEVFGDAVPTFRDPHELGPLVRRWVDDDDGRRAAAARAQAAVADHTWDWPRRGRRFSRGRAAPDARAAGGLRDGMPGRLIRPAN